jgi:hypothetical protein
MTSNSMAWKTAARPPEGPGAGRDERLIEVGEAYGADAIVVVSVPV